jgi:hypothetical protein
MARSRRDHAGRSRKARGGAGAVELRAQRSGVAEGVERRTAVPHDGELERPTQMAVDGALDVGERAPHAGWKLAATLIATLPCQHQGVS